MQNKEKYHRNVCRNPHFWSQIDREDGQRRIKLVKKLCDLQHSDRTLCHGKTSWDKIEHIAKFTRELDGEKICVMANFEKQTAVIAAVDGETMIRARAEVSGKEITLHSGGYIVIRQKEVTG